MFFRYAVGVHRRVDIYSIESAGIEYSIDMKVNIAVILVQFVDLSYLNPSVVNSKTEGVYKMRNMDKPFQR